MKKQILSTSLQISFQRENKYRFFFLYYSWKYFTCNFFFSLFKARQQNEKTRRNRNLIKWKDIARQIFLLNINDKIKIYFPCSFVTLVLVLLNIHWLRSTSESFQTLVLSPLYYPQNIPSILYKLICQFLRYKIYIKTKTGLFFCFVFNRKLVFEESYFNLKGHVRKFNSYWSWIPLTNVTCQSGKSVSMCRFLIPGIVSSIKLVR